MSLRPKYKDTVSGTFEFFLTGLNRNVLFMSWKRDGSDLYDLEVEEAADPNLAQGGDFGDGEYRQLKGLQDHDENSDHFVVDKMGPVIKVSGDTGSEDTELRIVAVVHQ